MEPWYAVGCGLILTWCGYMLGKPAGVKDGIETAIAYMASIGAIKVVMKDGEEHIELPDAAKDDIEKLNIK